MSNSFIVVVNPQIMGKTIRHYGRDGSAEHKFHRWYRRSEGDWIRTSSQGDLIKVRAMGKEVLNGIGINVKTRLNGVRIGSHYPRRAGAFRLSKPTDYPRPAPKASCCCCC